MRAYQAHALCLRDQPERAVISLILKDQSAPGTSTERRMNFVGRSIGAPCILGGWFIPMYGATRLERDNIGEYEIAAHLAWFAGHGSWTDELRALGEVRWDHELWLRAKATRHWAWR